MQTSLTAFGGEYKPPKDAVRTDDKFSAI